MKKIILVSVAAFLFMTQANAQSKKHEIDLGAGLGSSNQLIETMSDLIISGLPFQVKMENGSYVGALHAGYKYSLTDRFALGPVFAYDRGTKDAINKSTNSKQGKFTSNFYTLSLEADYKYINQPSFKLYSLVGAGGTLLNQVYKADGTNAEDKSGNQAFFNFQLTPIGVKFGDSFGAFAELGFGYKGILSAGLFCRF